jgi:threonylcarbamoyladenosine tRNA methylthiotransferase MtaB
LAKLPNVLEVVEDKRELPDVLARVGVNDFPTGISTFEGRRRAYVKVQDGCILNCTYCIIPQVRPGLRSRPSQDIDDEVRRLIDNGHKEIVLCGIHLGHYGVDATRGRSGKPPFRLAQLIEKLDRIPGDWRMRLSSIEAAEVSPDFVDAVTASEKLCPHFHPSLQSGSRNVLLQMKRRYSLEMFFGKMDVLRSRLDNPAFSTDVIVGFPGETDAEFRETLDVCEQAGFMKVHVFPFSARAGTPAADLPNQVSPEVKRERGQRLAELGDRLARRYYESLVGRDVQVLIERESRERPGRVAGTACRYAPVEIPGDSATIGQIINVRGTAVTDHGLIATRV